MRGVGGFARSVESSPLITHICPVPLKGLSLWAEARYGAARIAKFARTERIVTNGDSEVIDMQKARD